MIDRDEMGSVEKVSITILVDNKADLIVESSDRVKYFMDQPLLAEQLQTSSAGLASAPVGLRLRHGQHEAAPLVRVDLAAVPYRRATTSFG